MTISFRNIAPAIVGLSCCATSVLASGDTACALIENGSFQSEFDGWIVAPLVSYEGNSFADAVHYIFDGSILMPPMDQHVAVLQCAAYSAGAAAKESGSHSASSEIALTSAPFTITDRYLTFWTTGGFESLRTGTGQTTMHLHLTIESTNQTSLVHAVGNLVPPPFETCEIGMSILGTLFSDQPRVIDLIETDGAPSGLQLGDTVRIKLELKCETTATQLCDEAAMTATLGIDNLSLCPLPPGSVPGDVTGDGIVNVDDLLSVINTWGICGECPQDLAPPGPPQGNGVVDVDDLLAVVNNWT